MTLFDKNKVSEVYDSDTNKILSEIKEMKEKKYGPDWYKNFEYKKRNGRKKKKKNKKKSRR